MTTKPQQVGRTQPCTRQTERIRGRHIATCDKGDTQMCVTSVRAGEQKKGRATKQRMRKKTSEVYVMFVSCWRKGTCTEV